MSGQDIVRNDARIPAVAPLSAARLVSMIGLTLAFGYLTVLAGIYFNGNFLTDVQGHPIANDFVNVWAAGRLALDGSPVAACDWPLHKAAEVRAVGHDFANYYGWHYPPTFLFVAAALAMLPYLAAAIAWLVVTLAAYAATLHFILGKPVGIFVALGFPAAISNVTAGQNGFLTATLIGGVLGLLECQPVLAGVCLGLLNSKPQFGLLFPIVLIADRRWRVIAVAAAVTVGMAAASWLAFGAHGGSEPLAWTVQAMGSRARAYLSLCDDPGRPRCRVDRPGAGRATGAR